PLPAPAQGWVQRVSPDGKTSLQVHGVALVLHDWQTGKPRHDFDGHLSEVRSLAFSADGKRLASVGDRGDDLRLWDVKAHTTALKLSGHVGPQAYVRAVLAAPGGFVTGGSDSTLRLWDGTTGAELRRFPLEGRQQVLSMGLSADGKRLLCCSCGFGG